MREKRLRGIFAAGAWALLTFGPGLAVKDPDTPWHIRAGQLTLENFSKGIIGPTRVEPFSWSFQGAPWQPNGWGFDLLSALAFKLSWIGVSGLRAILLGVLVWLMYRRTVRFPPWSQAAALTVASMLFLPFVEMRPQLISFIFLLVGFELIKKLKRKTVLLSVTLFILIAIWSNMHGAVLAGLGLLGLEIIGIYLPRKQWGKILVVGSGALLGSVMNPYGIKVWLYAFATREESKLITEWQRPSVYNLRDDLTLLAGLACIFWLVRRRTRIISQLPILLTTLGAMFLSVDAIRNFPFLILVILPVLAGMLGSLKRTKLLDPRKLTVVCLVAANATALGQGLEGIDATKPRADKFPVTSAESLPKGCKLLNEYALGGYLILARPDIKVSQDGRNDVYGNQWLLSQERILNGDATLSEIEDLGINCVLIYPQRKLSKELEDSGKWVKISEDKVAEAWRVL